MRTMFLLLLPALMGCPEPVDPETQCGQIGQISVFADADGDGYGAPGTELIVCEIRPGFATNADDCDDFRAAVNPGAIELCDGIDNDCDAIADEDLREQQYYIDGDGDGWGDPNLDRGIISCAPPLGFVENRADCDDTNSGISPDGVEVCDEIDNNCNLLIDDQDLFLDTTAAPRWYADSDEDTFGDPEDVLIQCRPPTDGRVLNDRDCDDRNSQVYPGAPEFCNRIDDDCDQLIDDSDPDVDENLLRSWWEDNDLDGAGNPNVPPVLACFQPWFHVGNDGDCDDAEELLQGPAPWKIDGDNDGYGAGDPTQPLCAPPPDGNRYVLAIVGDDCDDTTPLVSPLSNEVCDNRDNDCNELTDDEDPDLDTTTATVFWEDSDDDGYGNPAEEDLACAVPPGFVAPDIDDDGTDDPDCDDEAPDVNLGAVEICDGIDNDCDVDIDDADDNLDLSTADTWYADFDMDGFGDIAFQQDACSQPVDYVSNSLDCDDTDDEATILGPWYLDGDGDGVGAGTASADTCVSPNSSEPWVNGYLGIDCDDDDEDRFPGNPELCGDGIDQDCDGVDPVCFASF